MTLLSLLLPHVTVDVDTGSVKAAPRRLCTPNTHTLSWWVMRAIAYIGLSLCGRCSTRQLEPTDTPPYCFKILENR